MKTSIEHNLNLINPNWSAFVLLVTLLFMVNVAVALLVLLPSASNAINVLSGINLAFGLILWVDFIYLYRKAPDKRRFMVDQRGWMVLLGSLPFLRLLRVWWFHWTLQKNGYTLRQFLSFVVINKNAQGTLLTVFFTALVIFEASVVFILYFEETAPGGNIRSVSDALWWTFVTMATVGYGDLYPVTSGGRIVAGVLMAVGIILFSVLTGFLAEWFLSQRAEVRSTAGALTPAEVIAEMKHILEAQEAAHQQTISELRTRLAHLEDKLKQL